MEDPRDLEERLLGFAVRIINVIESLPNTRVGNHSGGQLLPSGTSPAPNYGEVQSAESRKDSIHKMKIALKELRETLIWLRIIKRKEFGIEMNAIIDKCDQLIAIFVKSVKTAEDRDA